MQERVAGFDWDEGNQEKCQKHGVSLEEVELLFQGQVWVAPDLKHSQLEDRFLALGTSIKGMPIFVAFTFRRKDGQNFIRPISARYMHKKEVQRYEEAFAENEDR
jgi:uncharacterized DUF497 family protein